MPSSNADEEILQDCNRPLHLAPSVRSAELQLRAIANAPVPRRAGALRSDGKRAGVDARWRWNAEHIHLSALLLESAVPFGRSPARNDRMMVGDSILFKPILWKPCPE